MENRVAIKKTNIAENQMIRTDLNLSGSPVESRKTIEQMRDEDLVHDLDHPGRP